MRFKPLSLIFLSLVILSYGLIGITHAQEGDTPESSIPPLTVATELPIAAELVSAGHANRRACLASRNLRS